MDPNNSSRLVKSLTYPKIVYLEGLIMYFGANYIYHQSIFRYNQNKLQFAGFLLVNLFTSLQLAEATNVGVAKYYAAIYNNTKEFQHRSAMNQRLRERLFRQ